MLAANPAIAYSQHQLAVQQCVRYSVGMPRSRPPTPPIVDYRADPERDDHRLTVLFAWVMTRALRDAGYVSHPSNQPHPSSPLDSASKGTLGSRGINVTLGDSDSAENLPVAVDHKDLSRVRTTPREEVHGVKPRSPNVRR